MSSHSSLLAWRIPWTEELGGLQSMGWQRVRRDWAHGRLCAYQLVVMAEGAGSKLGNIKLITREAGTSEGATGAGEILGGSHHHSREQESSCPSCRLAPEARQKPVPPPLSVNTQTLEKRHCNPPQENKTFLTVETVRSRRNDPCFTLFFQSLWVILIGFPTSLNKRRVRDPTSPFWRSALGFLWKEWC